jgi:hypothetical protein
VLQKQILKFRSILYNKLGSIYLYLTLFLAVLALNFFVACMTSKTTISDGKCD